MTEKDKKRNSYLLRVYGITLKQYDALVSQQGGGCGICGKTAEEEGRSLAVDHNHETMEIRGVLCAYCNHRRIGRHKDWQIVQKMADYLKAGTGLFIPKPTKPRKRKKKNGKS